jgi:hypothetical protein
LFSVLEEISRLSSDFYHIMPKHGFGFTKLQPIDAPHFLEQEKVSLGIKDSILSA